MAGRKTWESLSPTHRQRLERGGITKASYESGRGSLAAARGHKSAADETQRRHFLRSRKIYVEMTATMLGRDEDEQMEHLTLYDEGEQMIIMEGQEEAYRLYRSGDHEGASMAFHNVQLQIGYLPYWLLPYHGKKF